MDQKNDPTKIYDILFGEDEEDNAPVLNIYYKFILLYAVNLFLAGEIY